MGEALVNFIAIPGTLIILLLLITIILMFAAPDRFSKLLAALASSFDHLSLKLGGDREFTAKFREPVKAVRKRNPPVASPKQYRHTIGGRVGMSGDLQVRVIEGSASLRGESTLSGSGTVQPPTGSGPGLTTSTPITLAERALDRELIESIAQHSRMAAVIATWAQVKRELKDAAARQGLPADLSWEGIVYQLVEKGVINGSHIQDAMTLGEVATLVEERVFSEEQYTYNDAMYYLDAADSLVTHLSAIDEAPSRSPTSP